MFGVPEGLSSIFIMSLILIIRVFNMKSNPLFKTLSPYLRYILLTGYFLLLLIIIQSIGSVSYADDATPTPELNGADTAWMMVSTALVMLMTMPGLALFYGGLVKKSSALNTMLMSVGAYALVSVTWFVFGYPLAFGNDVGGIIGQFVSPFFYNIVETNSLTGTIPTSVFAAFQMTFAAITVALISGSVVERMKFSSWMLFALIWSTVVYLPIAHWVWGGGWLMKLGALDFAGGTVVHINAGLAGLALALLLGKRKDTRLMPHQLGISIIGAGLLWFGWFGFNAGSALTSGQLAGAAFINTNTATAMALLTWMVLDVIKDHRATALGAISGAVAGLVAITPAAGFVNIGGALAIGVGASVLSFLAVSYVKPFFKYDDSLDVFGVHGISGIWGALATGIFACPWINSAGTGLIFGNPSQVGIQALAIIATGGYCFVMTLIIGKLIDMIIGLRVKPEDEIKGLDASLHEESAYGL